MGKRAGCQDVVADNPLYSHLVWERPRGGGSWTGTCGYVPAKWRAANLVAQLTLAENQGYLDV
jgi:hypothetical protein